MVTCYHVFCRTMVEPLPSCLDVFPRSFSRESPNRLARSKCWGAKRDVQLEFVITKVDDIGMVSKLRWRIWGWKAIRGVVGMKGLPVVSLNFFFLGGGARFGEILHFVQIEMLGRIWWFILNWLFTGIQRRYLIWDGHVMYTSSQPKMHWPIGSSTSFQQQTS